MPKPSPLATEASADAARRKVSLAVKAREAGRHIRRRLSAIRRYRRYNITGIAPPPPSRAISISRRDGTLRLSMIVIADRPQLEVKGQATSPAFPCYSMPRGGVSARAFSFTFRHFTSRRSARRQLSSRSASDAMMAYAAAARAQSTLHGREFDFHGFAAAAAPDTQIAAFVATSAAA